MNIHLVDALFDGLRHVSFDVSRLNSTNGRQRGSAEHASQNGIRQGAVFEGARCLIGPNVVAGVARLSDVEKCVSVAGTGSTERSEPPEGYV